MEKVILVVDDLRGYHRIYEKFIKEVLGDNYTVKCAFTLSEAAEILRDKNHEVVAAIIDNGFLLVPNGDRKGTARPSVADNGVETEKHKRLREGGAGGMLLRLIRHGKTGALTESSRQEIGEWDAYGDDICQRYKDIPVVWNTGTLEKGKVRVIRAIVAGEKINPDNSIFKDENTPQDLLIEIDDKTLATDKKHHALAVEFLRDQFKKQSVESPGYRERLTKAVPETNYAGIT